MAAELTLRRLVATDLPAYKGLRDATLAQHPEAFTSDAETESRRAPQGYLPRLGLDRPEGGQFTLGAWDAHGALVGALSCEREPRVKVRHIGHFTGIMVREDRRGRGVGRALVEAGIAQARRAEGLELLTLSVTSTNASAIRLYAQAGFRRYGTLPRALKIADAYHDKDLMVLTL